MIETLTKEATETVEKKAETHHLILFNDDVNTFDHVINLLIKVCKHNEIQAEQCATIVHYSGKCAIKTGEYTNLKIISEILSDSGLTVEIK